MAEGIRAHNLLNGDREQVSRWKKPCLFKRAGGSSYIDKKSIRSADTPHYIIFRHRLRFVCLVSNGIGGTVRHQGGAEMGEALSHCEVYLVPRL